MLKEKLGCTRAHTYRSTMREHTHVNAKDKIGQDGADKKNSCHLKRKYVGAHACVLARPRTPEAREIEKIKRSIRERILLLALHARTRS